MFMVDLLQWWYFRGWGVFASDLKHRLSDSLDFFSIGQLLKTLFKPYRQISANNPGFLDRFVSRLVGFFTRLFVIIFGGISIILESIIGIVLVVIWPLLPFAIIIGIALTIMGVTI